MFTCSTAKTNQFTDKKKKNESLFIDHDIKYNMSSDLPKRF